jgi:hypothetical protein
LKEIFFIFPKFSPEARCSQETRQERRAQSKHFQAAAPIATPKLLEVGAFNTMKGVNLRRHKCRWTLTKW